MDVQLMLDPAGRRRWLLTKALEIAPLGEALVMAQAAEDFISGTAAPSEITRAINFAARSEAQAIQPRSASNDQPPMMTAALAGFSSLASLDDVICYLRQGSEVFAEDEGADELLRRANVKRAEQGLPPFALLPTPPKAMRQDNPKKVALPRPPSARERSEWARSVVALPAA
jgi:hypothetical protein